MPKGWVTLKEALELDPNFEPGWSLDPETGRWHHPMFGFAEQRVQLGPDGMPAFDRVVIGETPVVNCPLYYWDPESQQWMVGIVHQTRPFADEAYEVPADPPITFAGMVMGFLEKLGNMLGKEALDAFESAEAGAVREALEEAGIHDVLNIEDLGYYWGNPTGPLVTPTSIIALEVDPTTRDTEASDASELIQSNRSLRNANR